LFEKKLQKWQKYRYGVNCFAILIIFIFIFLTIYSFFNIFFSHPRCFLPDL
jgi:hypothetical protein